MSQPPDSNSSPTRKVRRFRRTAWLLAAAVILAVGAVSYGGQARDTPATAKSDREQAGVKPGSNNDGGSESTLPSPPSTPVPSAPSAPQASWPAPSQSPASSRNERWAAEAAELPARDTVLSFIDTAASMTVEVPPAEADRAATPDFSAIATGSALGELAAQFEEFQDNNWTLKGTPELQVKGIENVEAGGVALRRVSICVDSSAVELKDQDGQILVAAAAPGTRTALNFYDLQEQNGTWLVVSHSFPDDPTC
jgi:hypothetical protein